MPVTPRFALSQDTDCVVVTIAVPHVRVAAAELDVDGRSLSFYCKPYLLKLTLPGLLVGDEDCDSDLAALAAAAPGAAPPLPLRQRASATYDAERDGGTLTVRVAKATRGEHFEGLDMITRLLQPPTAFPSRAAGASPRPVDLADDPVDNASALLAAASLLESPRGLPSRQLQRGRPAIEVLDSVDFAPDAVQNGIAATVAAPPPRRRSSCAVSAAASSSSAFSPVADAVAPDPPLLLPLPSAAFGLSESLSTPAYGFNRVFRGFFADLREELMLSVIALPEPDATSALERARLRWAAEEAAFDAERYAGDFLDGADDPVLVEALSFVPFWLQPPPLPPPLLAMPEPDDVSSAPASAAVRFTADWTWTPQEVAELAELPNREFIVDGEIIGGRASLPSPAPFPAATGLEGSERPERLRLLAGLVSILYGACYDARVTGGEPTVESGWTIATLSPLLSWLDDGLGLVEVEGQGGGGGGAGASSLSPAATAFAKHLGLAEQSGRVVSSASPHPAAFAEPGRVRSPPALAGVEPLVAAACVACLRRALCFPYLRRWDLARLVLGDVATLLLRGRAAILRVLLGTRRVLAREEARYLLNRLYLGDFCVWLQGVDGRALAALGAQVAAASAGLSRASRGLAHWGLARVEARAARGADLLGESTDSSSDE